MASHGGGNALLLLCPCHMGKPDGASNSVTPICDTVRVKCSTTSWRRLNRHVNLWSINTSRRRRNTSCPVFVLQHYQVARVLSYSRKSTMKGRIGSGNERSNLACAQGRQHRTSFSQQASGLQPLPIHSPQSSHLLHEHGRCCQQHWQWYFLPLRRKTMCARGETNNY